MLDVWPDGKVNILDLVHKYPLKALSIRAVLGSSGWVMAVQTGVDIYVARLTIRLITSGEPDKQQAHVYMEKVKAVHEQPLERIDRGGGLGVGWIKSKAPSH